MILLITFSILLATATSGRAASEWPQFRGPNGSGIAQGDNRAIINFGLDQNLLWKTPLPSGLSSPVIWGNRLFVTAHDKERQKLETICVERETGKVLWRHDAPAEKIQGVHPVNNAASATPAIDGEGVYVYFGSYGLIAYDFDGGIRWKKPLPEALTRFAHGSGTSPVVTNGRLILDVHLEKESHLLAVSCRDGETVWKAPKPLFNDGWSTPVVWREEEGDRVGMLNAGKFTAHDLKTGEELWWIHGIPNQICATPAVGEGFIYLTGTGVLGERSQLIPPLSFEEMILKYDADKDGRIGTDELPDTLMVTDRNASKGEGNMTLKEFLRFGPRAKIKSYNREEWQAWTKEYHEFARGDLMKTVACAVRTGGKNDVTESLVVWTESKGVPEVPSPLLYRSRLFFIRNGGLFACRDATTGKTIFEERLNAPGGYYASPIGAGGRIYTASDRGLVTVLEAADQFTIVAQTDLKESIMATPAIVEGKLYVRTASQLYAFGQK